MASINVDLIHAVGAPDTWISLGAAVDGENVNHAVEAYVLFQVLRISLRAGTWDALIEEFMDHCKVIGHEELTP